MHWLQARFQSKALCRPTAMDVLLPDHDRPVPACYLLHDVGENQSAWLRRSRVEVLAERYACAVVMPAGERSFWVDSPYAAAYGNYLREELPALCEAEFPLLTGRGSRFVLGCGLAGYGAIYAALGGDAFAGAASFSGVLDAAKLADLARYDHTGGFPPLSGLLPGTRPSLYLYNDTSGFSHDAAASGLRVRVSSGADGWEAWDAVLPDALDFLIGKEASSC